MKHVYKLALPLLAVASASAFTTPAEAIPAFARKHGAECSTCHLAWPQLNATGRKFKELGYRFTEDESAALTKGDFPVATALVARPYDKKGNGDTKTRAIHEAEVMVAGYLGDKVSGFFEIGAADDTNFNAELAHASLSYNYNKAFNLQFSWAGLFWSDSSGLISDNVRMTLGHVKAIDASFGGADGSIRSNRQRVGINGRPVEQLFYSIGYSGNSGSVEGDSPKTYDARLSYNITDDIMVGTYGVTGENDITTRSFSRYGVDFQADVSNARIQGMWLTANDDTAVTTIDEDNDAYSIQAMYVFNDKEGSPSIVPLVRYDAYQRNDGADDYAELTLNLTHYFSQNIKGYAEYWNQLDTPTGVDDDDRFTIQFVAAF